ncbi:alpha-galactosidase [Cohnella nanjingensis]|uniref:Alpha-galactosidase n=1 Tax=Cohnella nanjingensis TaxID=1387779 RepID=A0A7X0RMT5_9BACL|nr:alpha-galactosidase [Cohnella nanjingensis]MBB6669120.1 alpha-galactosidase [Cohnella nanjingensis]
MAIIYHEEKKLFELRTARTTYLFGLNGNGALQHLYWGEPIAAAEAAELLQARSHSSFDAAVDREAEEYGGWGGASYAEPGLRATFADGVRDLQLQAVGHAIEGEETLVLHLKDSHYELHVDVRYKIVDRHDLIERSVSIRNGEASPVRIEQAMAALWSVGGLPDYRLTHVTGRWAGEYQLRSNLLSEGKKVLESRRGFTGPHANPWFAIDDGGASETNGRVWFGALAWSGNWKLVFERTTFGGVRIAGGVNDFDGAFALAPGGTYDSPVFVGGYVSGGFGEMSRVLHRYEREEILPSSGPRKVLYNSWEATEFAVNVRDQLALAERAARLGVELFVVDDGWFGERNSDRAGLGDWRVNAEKFPNGLDELISAVKDKGMAFGLWVEPESVNPDSDLFRAHPDWIYRYPTRQSTPLRNQYLLNLGKPEVKAFVLDFMTELLSKHDISFIKWDMNRTVTEPGESGDAVAEHSIWTRHAENLYAIWAELRRRFPHVAFETCAGGGARIDLGILRYADQAWISDNTDARDRLTIQEGFTYAYSPSVMMCWVTEAPNGFNGRSLPLSYRFRSAMMGGLGIGANIGKWTDQEMAEAARYVALYKEIRHVVSEGELYRLESLRHSNVAAYEYVSRDGGEAVVFAFLQSQHFGGTVRRLRLRGLDPNAVYEVKDDDTAESTIGHGSTLMHLGLPLALRGDYDSWLLRLRRVDASAKEA